MDAYVYLQVQPGHMTEVLAALSAAQGVRRAIAVVGEWDVLLHAEGTDMGAIASVVLSELHNVPGVTRTLTAPVVPGDRIGMTGFGGPVPPPIIPNACYVHMKAEPGAAGGIAEHLADMGDVAGVAVIGGEWDLLACVAEPWEVASGIILDRIQQIPGVRDTGTLVSIAYDGPDEDRDQFSAWS
jgi:hypothetical protein